MFLLQAKIAEMLVEKAKVDLGSIVVLSPYNAQVSEIKEELKRRNLGQITVTTITKSQGNTFLAFMNEALQPSLCSTLYFLVFSFRFTPESRKIFANFYQMGLCLTFSGRKMIFLHTLSLW